MPEFSALAPAGLSARLEGRDPWQLAELAELCHGSLLKHRFVLTHSGRRSAAELFAGSGIERAIPSLTAQLRFEDEGEVVVLTNGCHKVAPGSA